MINPIAGMGGRVGLKGTDGVIDAAVDLGAQPTAHLKAGEALKELSDLIETSGEGPIEIDWLTCAGEMGAECLQAAGFARFEIIHEVLAQTTDQDTKSAAKEFLDRGADLILFCGGDGTARDLCSVVGDRMPLLGIPAGVKMYSGVFGMTPRRTAEVLLGYLQGRLATTPVGPRTPILHLAFSRHLHGDGDTEDMLKVARLLVDAGADSSDGYIAEPGSDHALSALYGAIGHGDNPVLGRFLLEAGANPNDNESLYHATEKPMAQ